MLKTNLLLLLFLLSCEGSKGPIIFRILSENYIKLIEESTRDEMYTYVFVNYKTKDTIVPVVEPNYAVSEAFPKLDFFSYGNPAFAETLSSILRSKHRIVEVDSISQYIFSVDAKIFRELSTQKPIDVYNKYFNEHGKPIGEGKNRKETIAAIAIMIENEIIVYQSDLSGDIIVSHPPKSD